MGIKEGHPAGTIPRKSLLRDEKRSGLFFLIVNISGWIAFSLFQLATIRRENATDPQFLTWFAWKTAIGFSVSIALRWLYKHVGFQKGRVPSRVLIIFVASFVAANVWYFGEFTVTRALSIRHDVIYPLSQHYLMGVYVQRIFMNLWIMGSWSALYLGIKFWIDWLVQRERAERMEALAQKAQLEMLRYQLNPHFLFNALYSIRAMAGEECADMKEMINNLSAILRYSLDSNRKDIVPLSEEIEIIRRYLDIEKTRFDELIDINIEVEEAAENYPIPCFLIHPLVENAVKYGMRSEKMPLRVELKAMIEYGSLVVSVFDSGSWVDHPDLDDAEPGESDGRQPDPGGTGTGLSNVRRRLEVAYPGNHLFDIERGDNGVLMRITIGRGKAEA